MLRRMTNDPNRTILSKYEIFGKDTRQTAAENYMILTPAPLVKNERITRGRARTAPPVPGMIPAE